MKQFYYQSNGQSYGPYSASEIVDKKLPKGTYIWYEGLDSWILIEKSTVFCKYYNGSFIDIWGVFKYTIIILFALCILFLCISGDILFATINTEAESKDDIQRTAFNDPSVDFNVYLEKFYRDIEFYRIRTVMPNSVTIKFANLDKYKGTVNYNGISYGYNDDSKIEIYVNPTFWNNATKAQKYWMIYHELCHDLLNLDHTPELPENIDKLMYPHMDCSRITHMDDFIEAYQETFILFALQCRNH